MKPAVGSIDISQGPIWRRLLDLFFPLWFGTFFQQLYNTVDALVVSQVEGTAALAAVGCTGSVVSLTVGLLNGLVSGAVVVIAQRYGARQEDGVHRAVHTAMLLSLVLGAVFMAVSVPTARPILELMRTTEDTIDDASAYLQIYFLGMIPSVVYNMGTGVFRAIGDTRRPLLFLIAASGCNIVLDLVLVAGLGLGVRGAAVATVLSQLLSAVLVVVFLMRAKGESYRFIPRKMRFYGPALRSLLLVGVPAALQSLMYSLSNMVIQSAINGFETDAVAAWTAYGKVDVLFWMTLNSMSLALTTFAGQSYGMGDYGRLRRGVKVSAAMTAGFTAVMSTAMVLLARPILRLFITDSDAVLELGVHFVRFLAPCYITYILVELLAGAIRGAGRSVGPMVITAFGVCVLRLVWLFLVVPRFHTIDTVVLSYPITWTVTSLAMLAYYCRAKWLEPAGGGDTNKVGPTAAAAPEE